MAGQKRTRTGQIKAPKAPQEVTETTPPCAQPQLPPSTSTEAQSTSKATTSSQGDEAQSKDAPDTNQTTKKPTNTKQLSTSKNSNRSHTKLPKLPPNTSISKRPLLHPPLPTPFASSTSPKILYITASTPFVPALKRIRKLLSEISRREKQSTAALSKRQKTRSGGSGGKLKNADVEKGIAEEVAAAKLKASSSLGGGSGEKVYLKATGRAIPRALELGVQFQGEESGEYIVKVEMGSVRAVDDVEVSGDGNEGEEDIDIPETRMRNVSSVTISIAIK